MVRFVTFYVMDVVVTVRYQFKYCTWAPDVLWAAAEFCILDLIRNLILEVSKNIFLMEIITSTFVYDDCKFCFLYFSDPYHITPVQHKRMWV